MACNMRKRKDDIPKKNPREKTWHCEECGALVFAERKPLCRKVVKAEMVALHVFAEMDPANPKES
jgi:ABC-type ATPase with predicted acetyltransferase domain